VVVDYRGRTGDPLIRYLCQFSWCSVEQRWCVCVYGVQKARLSRLHQSKLAARRAIAEGTRRFDDWQRRCGRISGDVMTSTDRRDGLATTRSSMDVSAGQPLAKKDLFEMQHFHLLRCLEHATVLC